MEKKLIIIFYSFLWFIVTLNIYFFARVICLLKNELRDDYDLIYRYIGKLKWFPIVQILSLLPATINKLYYLTSNDKNFPLSIIQALFDGFTGLLFSLLYINHPSVKNALNEFYAKTFKKRNSINVTGMSFVSEIENKSRSSSNYI
jgi:hypothetical protein